MGFNAKSEILTQRIDRRMFLIWFATRGTEPLDRNAVVGVAIAGRAIAGNSESEDS